ncbi:hypothetical protein LTR56_013089 [Elasticomyces elasticus]|nr:hypothetical protein LTR56_013089 [Elasticomyces elasticus]KAK3640268.1 hypothetical protein LTR22_017103 [Elasticomyces elasticus]KAK4920545.1 hypothetical protein LTR49_011960 [Elasticomyces elasticus]KAK5758955.1 hypothetical protein LTS12_010896 [Elasticomyces elasticus]
MRAEPARRDQYPQKADKTSMIKTLKDRGNYSWYTMPRQARPLLSGSFPHHHASTPHWRDGSSTSTYGKYFERRSDDSLCHNCNLEEDWLIKHDRFGGAIESDVSLLSLEQKRYCRETQMRPRDFAIVEMLLLGRMLELVKQPDLPLWWRTSMVQNIWAHLKELQQSGRLYKTLDVGKCAAAMTFLCEMWCRKIERSGNDVTAEGMEKFVKTFRALLDRRLREQGQPLLSDS